MLSGKCSFCSRVQINPNEVCVECIQQETFREVGKWASNLIEMIEHGDYSNGIEAFGCDEGRVLAAELLSKYQKDVKALNRGEMPKQEK